MVDPGDAESVLMKDLIQRIVELVPESSFACENGTWTEVEETNPDLGSLYGRPRR